MNHRTEDGSHVVIDGIKRDIRRYEVPGSGNRLSRDCEFVIVPNSHDSMALPWHIPVSTWEIVLGACERE